jgi:hypothetical protein
MAENTPDVLADRRSQVAEAAAVAAFLLAYRVFAPSARPLWGDWVMVAGVSLGLTLLLASKPRSLRSVTTLTAAYLLATYLQGQIPRALSTLGLGP